MSAPPAGGSFGPQMHRRPACNTCASACGRPEGSPPPAQPQLWRPLVRRSPRRRWQPDTVQCSLNTCMQSHCTHATPSRVNCAAAPPSPLHPPAAAVASPPAITSPPCCASSCSSSTSNTSVRSTRSLSFITSMYSAARSEWCSVMHAGGGWPAHGQSMQRADMVDCPQRASRNARMPPVRRFTSGSTSPAASSQRQLSTCGACRMAALSRHERLARNFVRLPRNLHQPHLRAL